MKIRKRQAAADVLTRDAALPISWKYQKPREWPTAAAPPAGLQVQVQQQGRGGLESSGYNISDGRKSSSPCNNEETVAMEVTSEGQQQQVPAGLNIALNTLVCSLPWMYLDKIQCNIGVWLANWGAEKDSGEIGRRLLFY